MRCIRMLILVISNVCTEKYNYTSNFRKFINFPVRLGDPIVSLTVLAHQDKHKTHLPRGLFMGPMGLPQCRGKVESSPQRGQS